MTTRPRALLAELRERARQIRVNVIRIAGMSECHTGGSLSLADLLAVLYFHTLRVDPQRPDWEERDYLILSKGHCVPAVDAALALRGFFPEAALTTHLEPDSIISGHACAHLTPGIEVSTGSLGHGLPLGLGLALALRLDHAPNRVFVILGDGELQEGSNWEAAMAAAHHRADNLIAIVDRNRYQTGPTEQMLALEPLADKWAAFGWDVRVRDGHDLEALVTTLDAVPFSPGKPSLLLAETTKGRGVSFLETHHMARLNAEQLAAALAELGEEGEA